MLFEVTASRSRLRPGMAREHNGRLQLQADGMWVRFPFKEKRYKIFSFPRSGKESRRRASRIQRKVGNKSKSKWGRSVLKLGSHIN